MHQVLARKWRPRTFGELVGQPAVVRALTNAIRQNRLHHAYLLTGTRGVGKTTLGRILARCLNCTTGPTAEPCGQCSACVEIAEGRHVDLIEVDAASRTRVDDTRELLENAQYAPVSGRFKVYLIDEVHMLSEKSFNALLKTLEEPPEHVKFILATTDPQKLPITVVSRCLQFSLQPMPVAIIAEHLAVVLAAEGIEADAAALERIGAAAQGSMRDALSLTEQAIAFAAGRLTDALVCDMLGLLPQAVVQQLLDALFAGDAPALLETLAVLRRQAPDWARVLADAADLCYQVALVQMAARGAASPANDGAAADLLPTRSGVAQGWLQDVAAMADPERVQLTYQILILGGRDLPFAPSAEVGAEMTLLRAAGFWPSRAAPARRPQGEALQRPAAATVASTPDRGAAGPAADGVAPAASGSERAPDMASNAALDMARNPATPSAAADSAPALAQEPGVADRESQPVAAAATGGDASERMAAKPSAARRGEPAAQDEGSRPIAAERSSADAISDSPLDLGADAGAASDSGFSRVSSSAAAAGVSEPGRVEAPAAAGRPSHRATRVIPPPAAQIEAASRDSVPSSSSEERVATRAAQVPPASRLRAGENSDRNASEPGGSPLPPTASERAESPADRRAAADAPLEPVATQATAAESPARATTAGGASDTFHAFDWEGWVASLDAGPVRELAANAVGEWDPTAGPGAAGVLRLRLAPVAATLAGATRLARLRASLQPVLGDGFELERIDDPGIAERTPNALHAAAVEARRQRLEAAVHGHPVVRALQGRLGARVVRIDDPGTGTAAGL